MDETEMQMVEERINKLIIMAVESEDCDRALKYTQAAANAANAMHTVVSIREFDETAGL